MQLFLWALRFSVSALLLRTSPPLAPQGPQRENHIVSTSREPVQTSHNTTTCNSLAIESIDCSEPGPRYSSPRPKVPCRDASVLHMESPSPRPSLFVGGKTERTEHARLPAGIERLAVELMIQENEVCYPQKS
ncbi:uncharacterized protein BDR25DRAFT_129490 [Lindgomyces ingoldianus]|uniref:Uncharacterized protein n=1 Tax=Lindgomyces ingoldianus TaxID=673940 RepID=A0ACB6R1Q5_9PLEO|nr:uncharacterized protein BDR25DRAFT_129490 [Lindgomyces ingoldianus]KAF2473189.1 hypothetical protein BDR25DRAFT_129490 [Lindgomyces ingoldianus]